GRTYRIGDLKQLSTVAWGDGWAVYIKGRATHANGEEVGVLSNGKTVSPGYEVKLIREDNRYFHEFGGFVEVQDPGKTVENTSTYGYHDSKKSANVVVNTTTSVYVPGAKKQVAREGYDANGYR